MNADSQLMVFCRRFHRLVLLLQSVGGGAPVSVSIEAIEEATGISRANQIRVRQLLMRSGVLRLSDCDGRWGYSVSETLA